MTKMTYHQREYAELMAKFISPQPPSSDLRDEKRIVRYMDRLLRKFDGTSDEVVKCRRLRSLMM